MGFGVLCHRHKCACGFVKDDFIDVVHGDYLMFKNMLTIYHKKSVSNE
ncbi:hypothetical protein AO373_0806 [Moraxella catarrhalis]|nr:hypothetical protein AO378_1478 [Moraxella catarrhalis]OAV19197.1 hypothetical protein AO373_0806 [Moraxella catarrhalis]